MAFGKKIATAAARAERRLDLEQSQDQAGGPVPAAPPAAQSPAAQSPAAKAPSPARPAFPSRPAPAGRPAFVRPQAATGAAASPPPMSTPQAAPAMQARAPVPSGAAPAGGYVRRVKEEAARTEGLSLTLERLIDEVCDFMGMDDARRAEQKTRALSNPGEWERRLQQFFRQTIRPARASTAQTLEEGRRKHPGQVVFMVVKGSKATLEVLDRDTPAGRAQAILDGATVELVTAARTPFAAPADLFGRARASQELESSQVDEAFGEGAAPAPVPGRPCRPT